MCIKALIPICLTIEFMRFKNKRLVLIQGDIYINFCIHIGLSIIVRLFDRSSASVSSLNRSAAEPLQIAFVLKGQLSNSLSRILHQFITFYNKVLVQNYIHE